MIGNIKKIKSIKFNYNLGKKTWFGTGGNCTLFFLADSINHLKMILRITKRLIPILVIGSGSNILVRDGGFKGIGIKLGKDFRKIELDKQNFTVSVGSGVKDSEFSKFCLQEEICGFEFLSGIPGTIGGNLKMNAGCYGSKISDNLIECKVLDDDLNIVTLSKEAIKFNYRQSSFNNNQIILNAKFSYKKSKKIKIKKKIDEISSKRKETQPVSSRTGGSTFINPPNKKAWKLIDAINYRGKRIGGAEVSKVHSNFLINNDSASSMDIELLGEEIRKIIKIKFNINLKWELVRIGEFKKV